MRILIMSRFPSTFVSLAVIGALLLAISPVLFPLEADEQSRVNALFFYNPGCEDCTNLISNLLPDLIEQHPEQLRILAVNTSSRDGGTLFLNSLLKYSIPFSTRLPILVVEDQYLGGGTDISSGFPLVLGNKLTQGGANWPQLDGLSTMIRNTEAEIDPDTSFWISDKKTNRLIGYGRGVLLRLRSDPRGNAASLAVLFLMLGSVGYKTFFRKGSNRLQNSIEGHWVVPVLAIVGMGISTYLTYVKLSQSEAFCGPLGDCNAVQQSSYSSFFGVMPVSLAGFGIFSLILVFWCLLKIFPGNYRLWGNLNGLLTLSSVLFFIYLTFLEPFVIGATCMWCLFAALTMTTLYWMTDFHSSSA